MNRTTLVAVCFCLLPGPARGQQIGTVDLTQQTKLSESAQEKEKYQPPKGCKNLLPGDIADGAVSPPEHGPHEIVVEIVKINAENAAVGSDVQGEVRLQNSGEYSIQIPWSTDPQTMWQGQDPNYLEWDYGYLSFDLQGTGSLKTLSQPLHGSKYVAGSMLTIQPGEWITFKVKFKLEPEDPIPGRVVNQGEGQLQVGWVQTLNAWNVHNCSVAHAFFQYRGYYDQQNPPITIKIN